MSPEAAMAMKMVLCEVGSTAWEPLHSMLEREATLLKGGKPTGAAASFSRAARIEAATKIITNHFRLLNDVCNPTKSTNADQIDLGLTQVELLRVHPHFAPHVDEGLREVAQRLIGLGATTILDPTREAVEARAAAARYLHLRIQSKPDQKPGRRPDLSPEGAAAMKAVLSEVGSTAWEPLHDLFQERGVNEKCRDTHSVAINHSAKARKEAVTAVLGNHVRLLIDVCNPSAELNIDATKLTQTELNRVPAADAPHVDEGLREAIRLLMGHGTPRAVLSSASSAQAARAQCAKYLRTRIQDEPSQKPGRKPDMSAEAGAALKDVLDEVGSIHGTSTPMPSRKKMSSSDMMAEGLANELEHLAAQLRVGGDATPRQVHQIREHLKKMNCESDSPPAASSSSSGSNVCILM